MSLLSSACLSPALLVVALFATAVRAADAPTVPDTLKQRIAANTPYNTDSEALTDRIIREQSALGH